MCKKCPPFRIWKQNVNPTNVKILVGLSLGQTGLESYTISLALLIFFDKNVNQFPHWNTEQKYKKMCVYDLKSN